MRILAAILFTSVVGCSSMPSRLTDTKPGTGKGEANSRPVVTASGLSGSTSNTPGTTGAGGAATLPNREAAKLNLTLAKSCEKDGKDWDSVPHYMEARRLDPTCADEVSRRLAVVYDRIGEQAEAMKEFQELLKKSPKDSNLLADVGYSYYNRGKWADSEAFSRRALAADKSNKRAWVNLGMALGQQGKSQDSIAAFEKAVSPAEARYNLGFVLASQGKKDESMTAYKQALQLEPTLQNARVALGKLESGNQLPEIPSANPDQQIQQAQFAQPAPGN